MSLIFGARSCGRLLKGLPKVSTVRALRTTGNQYASVGAPNAVGKHSALWNAERLLSVGLVGVIPAALAFPSQGLDVLMSLSVVMHQHWGLEAVITDYVRPVIFGNVIPKVAHSLLLVYSIALLGGLVYFSYNDIGVANAVRKVWGIKSQ